MFFSLSFEELADIALSDLNALFFLLKNFYKISDFFPCKASAALIIERADVFKVLQSGRFCKERLVCLIWFSWAVEILGSLYLFFMVKNLVFLAFCANLGFWESGTFLGFGKSVLAKASQKSAFSALARRGFWESGTVLGTFFELLRKPWQ